EQCAGTELRPRETPIDVIERAVGRFCREAFGAAEHRRERVVEPDPRRRAAKQVIVPGERAPYLARVALDGAAVAPRNAEILEPDPLAVEHAEDVVVGRDEERGGI